MFDVEQQLSANILALMFHRSREQTALVTEMIIDRDLRHAGGSGDGLDSGGGIAMVEKCPLCGDDDRIALGGVGYAASGSMIN